MDIATILLIAISLSFDSFAASVCSGLSLCRKHLRFKQAFRIAGTMAIFQGGLPVLGWLLGATFKDVIVQADHWIAFGLLLFLGVRMIREGQIPIAQKKVKNPTHWKVLIPMSIATSIDAFAIGVGFSFFVESITMPAVYIGVVTFIVSIVGIYMGRKLGQSIAGKAEIIGGLILIGIGTKILIEHLFFS